MVSEKAVVSLEEALEKIAHCPKQVIHDNPEYECNFDCENCPNNKHSLCTSIVLEKLGERAAKIQDEIDPANMEIEGIEESVDTDEPLPITITIIVSYLTGYVDAKKEVLALLVGGKEATP